MPVVRWYLNLASVYGRTRKGRAGTAIGLVATRSLGHGLRSDGNREVDWTLVEAGPDDADLDYFATAATLAADRTGEVNGQFQNTLNITALGGRTFTVTAVKASGAQNVAFNKQFQSWRRVYYSVHYMNPRCQTLFTSIEQEIKDIFAGVFIELKPRGIRACIVNEATTDAYGVGGVTLTHTYNDTRPSLDRSDEHLRVVIARDVVKSVPFAAHWTMDSTTTAVADRLIQISSTGINHREVVYANKIAAINALDPTQTLTVSVHDVLVAIPGACIARNGAHGLRVDLGADLTTTPIATALSASRKANLVATLTGRRCAAGYAVGNDHEVRATLVLANIETNPVVVGSARVWVADAGASVFVDDPQILLASPGAADQLRVTLSNSVVVDVDAGRITRVSEHKLELDLGGEALVQADIAQHPITVSVRRHGLLANGPIEAQAGHDFDLREFTQGSNATRRNVGVRVDFAGHIDVEANWLALAAVDPLAMRIETLSAPIDVPAVAVTVPTPQQLKIDLSADPALQTAAAAMAAGRKLTFDAKIKGIHSLGGYSPSNARSFIALTTRMLSDDEDTAVTARRLKLVFCHELGHALGLNFTSVQNHRLNRRQANDLVYNSTYGGQGDHCSYNARLEPSGAEHGRESTTSGEIYVSNRVGRLCIMYHSIDLTNMGDDFCPTCKAHLRRTRVTL